MVKNTNGDRRMVRDPTPEQIRLARGHSSRLDGPGAFPAGVLDTTCVAASGPLVAGHNQPGADGRDQYLMRCTPGCFVRI